MRQVIQDLVSPDLKALAAGQPALKEQMALQFRAAEERTAVQFKAVQEQADIQNKVVMTTLEAFRAELR